MDMQIVENLCNMKNSLSRHIQYFPVISNKAQSIGSGVCIFTRTNGFELLEGYFREKLRLLG